MGGAHIYIYIYIWGNLRETDNLEDQGLDLRLILNWIFRKGDGGNGLD